MSKATVDESQHHDTAGPQPNESGREGERERRKGPHSAVVAKIRKRKARCLWKTGFD